MELKVDAHELRSLVEAVVTQTIERLGNLPENQLAFSEEQASRILGVERWTLRDFRLKSGDKLGTVRIGRKVVWPRHVLLKLLADPSSVTGGRR